MKKKLGAAVWTVCMVNLLLSVAVNAFYPVWLHWNVPGEQLKMNAIAIASYVVGLYLFGPLNTYIVEMYRRRNVCLCAILLLAATVCAYYSLEHTWVVTGSVRLLQGASFALLQMGLGTTMLNDLTDSGARTTSDVLYGWFGRLGLPLGLFFGFLCLEYGGGETVCWFSFALCALSFVLLFNVHLPFRAPIDVKKYSLDRFWLPQGKWIFLNLFLVALTMGMFVAQYQGFTLYLLMTVGVLVAWVAQEYAFASADVRAEIVCGGVLMAIAFVLLNGETQSEKALIAFVLAGLGFGLSSSRFLLYFLKMSGHCQRGTAQHTCMLSCETGVGLGFTLGYFVGNSMIVSAVVVLVAVFFYIIIVHPDFIKYGDRGFRIRKL